MGQLRGDLAFARRFGNDAATRTPETFRAPAPPAPPSRCVMAICERRLLVGMWDAAQINKEERFSASNSLTNLFCKMELAYLNLFNNSDISDVC
jgi:hypothetical protein